MTSLKVKFRPSTVAGCEGTIYYQIIHDRRIRQIPVDYHIYEDEWDETAPIVGECRSDERVAYIMSVRENIRHDCERLTRIINRMESDSFGYSVDNVVDEFARYCSEYTVFSFMQQIIRQLGANGRTGTVCTYMSTLRSFRKFRHGVDLMLDAVTPRIVEDYQAWLDSRGVMPNTVSFYMRILRAVYNRAVEQEIVGNRQPFRRVYTGVDRTVKRALPLSVIRRIRSLDLSRQPRLDYARDMFMMSFYLRGMSFVDMAFLRKTDLRGGYIVYRRRKTGQQLTIEWTREMKTLLAKYPANTGEYLLPIITRPCVNERRAYLNKGYSINRNLKAVAAKAGVIVPLTLYVARHSWASIAHAKGIPLSVISEGMGHDSEATTRIYLASLDTSVVDRANSLIISALR